MLGAPLPTAKRKRKLSRLRYFDYGNTGAYYVTINTHDRKCFLSVVDKDQVHLTSYGQIVDEEIQRTITMRDNLSLGPYIIMPNHVHMILFFHDRTAEPLHQANDEPLRKFGGSHDGTLSSIIGNMKSAATSRIRRMLGKPQAKIWQGRFYEHIVRDEEDLIRTTDYIVTNPITWHYDHENPDRIHP